mmetsp:Transcript_130725/g.419257  ORF Transcript_130725/g.419257 Transcript_130725/m.419257 type:complete len:256 (+) Transcript_130725:1064-1831(+)
MLDPHHALYTFVAVRGLLNLVLQPRREFRQDVVPTTMPAHLDCQGDVRVGGAVVQQGRSPLGSLLFDVQQVLLLDRLFKLLQIIIALLPREADGHANVVQIFGDHGGAQLRLAEESAKESRLRQLHGAPALLHRPTQLRRVAAFHRRAGARAERRGQCDGRLLHGRSRDVAAAGPTPAPSLVHGLEQAVDLLLRGRLRAVAGVGPAVHEHDGILAVAEPRRLRPSPGQLDDQAPLPLRRLGSGCHEPTFAHGRVV